MTAPYGAGSRKVSGNANGMRVDLKTPSSINIEHPINSKSFDVDPPQEKVPAVFGRHNRPPTQPNFRETDLFKATNVYQ